MTVVDSPECEQCGFQECCCCSECESYPCQCCMVCGATNEYGCDCCGSCDCYPCECEEFDGHGISDEPPWTKRGLKFTRTSRSSLSWENVWPEIDKNIDPVQCASDFYLLEAITSRSVFFYRPININLDDSQDQEMLDAMGVTDSKKRAQFIRDKRRQVKHLLAKDPTVKLQVIEKEASRAQIDLIKRLDRSFVPYVHMAIAGEVRHHRAINGRFLSGERDCAWSEWRDIYEAFGTQAILDVRDMFLEMTDGSYGGEPWADAAYILYQRCENMLGPNQDSNSKLFVDRVFSLQHNGGALLDKLKWESYNDKGWHVCDLSKLLDAHASSEPDYVLMARVASPRIRQMFYSYIEYGINVSSDPKLPNILSELNLKRNWICRSCGSDADRGHEYWCIRATERCEPNEPIRNFGLFSVRWGVVDPTEFPDFYKDFYPLDQYYRVKDTVILNFHIEASVSKLYPNDKFHYSVAGTINDLIKVFNIEQVIREDVRKAAEASNIDAESLAVKLKVDMEGQTIQSNVMSLRLDQNWFEGIFPNG